MATAELLAAGQAALAAGRAAEARRAARAVLSRRPGEPRALALLANACLALERLDEAISSLEALLRQRPEDPALRRALALARNRRGARRLGAGEHAAAAADLERALALLPELPEAWFNLAALHRERGQRAHARAALERVLALRPDDDAARLLAAELSLEEDAERAAALLAGLAGEPEAALVARLPPLLDALAARGSAPTLPATWAEAATAAAVGAAMDGSLAVARGALAAIAQGVPPGTVGQRGAAWLLAETALGAVPESAAELARWREGFAAGLARLEARLENPGFPPRGSLAAIAAAPFFLAYHGEDDRPLLSRLGDLLARAASRLRPELAAAGQRPPAGRRAAMVSSFLRDCTVGHYFASWIPALRAAGFELCLVQLGPRQDAFTERLGAAAGRLRIVAEGPDALADWLAAERFDLILYPELGMDGRVLAVAALRLAPLQLCAWGHPITSGLPTIDAFLSVSAMEPEQGEAHYRERLLRLPGLGTAYPVPPPPEPLDRASLGLPARRPLLFYPHAPFKIHPEDDALLAALAAARPGLAVVLFEGERPSFRARLERRLARAFAAAGADPARQLLWLPLMPRRRFLAVARACDLMLDCLRWSGGNTTLDALSVGLPVLTRPGRFMRGRQSAAMLAMIGADGLVAGSREDLLAHAVRLLDEAELRAAWRARLETDAPALYGRGEAGPGLAAALEALLAGASPPA